jgi:ABC-type uncharacterized transport system permease subunit
MEVTHLCFGASYFLALLGELGRQFRPEKGFRYLVIFSGCAGLLAHTIFLGVHQPSPAKPYGSLLLLTWVLAVFYLYGAVQKQPRPWALFILPLILIFVAISFAFFGEGASFGSWFLGESFWGQLHGILLELAAVGITLAFLASVMYLFQVQRLKKKKILSGRLKLLSLERLEIIQRRCLDISFPLLTAGVLIGGIRGVVEIFPKANWATPKIVGTVLLWIIVGLLVYLRHAANVSPKRLAFTTIIAFVLLFFAMVTAHPFVLEGK